MTRGGYPLAGGVMNASKLSVGMFGHEVKTLHDRLRQHGIELPASEVERAFFGPGTRHAVQQYHAALGLPVRGEAGERTGATFPAALALGTPCLHCKAGINCLARASLMSRLELL